MECIDVSKQTITNTLKHALLAYFLFFTLSLHYLYEYYINT